MKTEKRRRGDFGERAALFYLLRRFYRVLARNYQADGGEIDLVAKRGGTLIFFEVKTRRLDPETETTLTKPAAAVDRDKRANLIAAARQWLGYHPTTRKEIRFDVIEVYLDPKKKRDRVLRIHHIRSAFRLP